MNKVKTSASMILVLVMVFCAGAATGSVYGEYAGLPRVKVMVNGSEIKSDVPGVVLNGRTMLPARAIAEAAGMDVSWDENTFTASLTTKKAGTSITQLPIVSNPVKPANPVITAQQTSAYRSELMLTHDLLIRSWNEAYNDWHYGVLDNENDLDQIDSHMIALKKNMPQEYATAYDSVKLMYQAYVDAWSLLSGTTWEEVWLDKNLREAYQEYFADMYRASDNLEKELDDLQ